MAPIPLTFLSTVPGETRYALVNKTQARTVLGHGPDTERLLDEAVATGGVQVANGLFLLSGHALAALQSARRRELPHPLAKYLRDLASVFAVPESVRRADPRHGALEDLRDPWRRKVLHETSLRDLRWWHVALLVFLGACIAFPPLALVAAIVVGIFALLVLSLALLAWGLGG